MGNLRVNIRFLQYHLQITDNWKVSITYNVYHKKLEYGWFDVCTWEPFKRVD